MTIVALIDRAKAVPRHGPTPSFPLLRQSQRRPLYRPLIRLLKIRDILFVFNLTTAQQAALLTVADTRATRPRTNTLASCQSKPCPREYCTLCSHATAVDPRRASSTIHQRLGARAEWPRAPEASDWAVVLDEIAGLEFSRRSVLEDRA